MTWQVSDLMLELREKAQARRKATREKEIRRRKVGPPYTRQPPTQGPSRRASHTSRRSCFYRCAMV